MAAKKYEMLFGACYDLLKYAVLRHTMPGSRVLDIGISNGNVEWWLEEQGIPCDVVGVDTDAEALDELRGREWNSVKIESACADAFEFMDSPGEFIGTKADGLYDQVLVSSTLHEINDWKFQLEWLCWFVDRVDRYLKPGGLLIIGDYYFPSHVSDAQVKKYMEFQLSAINHADAREKFVNPRLILNVAKRYGFKLIDKLEIRAVTELDRRYYVLVLKRDCE